MYVKFLFIVVSSLIKIPDSLSCMLDSRGQVFGFQKQKFLEFREIEQENLFTVRYLGTSNLFNCPG